MLEVSSDICSLFNADRLTIYIMGEDKASIISKVKTGLNSFKDLKLPIAEHSIAGYVGLSRKMLNLRDVYDDAELKGHNPNLRFLQEVDKRTGYRTKQMLVAPILDAPGGRADRRRPDHQQQGRRAVRPARRGGRGRAVQDARHRVQAAPEAAIPKTKYDYLIADAVLSAGEFELAARPARKKAVDVEKVLIEESRSRRPRSARRSPSSSACRTSRSSPTASSRWTC